MKKNAFIVKYDQESYIINPKQKMVIGGVLFTPLGESIIKFFNPTWNSNGHSIFKDWIESISPEIADVMPLLTPQ